MAEKATSSKSPTKSTKQIENNDITGLVSSLSPVKTSKETHKDYFDMDFTTKEGTNRMMCFDKYRHSLFADVNDSSSEGISVKRPRIDDKSNDIMITDFTKINKVKITDKIEPKIKLVTLIKNALSSKALFERFEVTGILKNLSHSQPDKKLKLLTGQFHDQSGYSNITIFGDIGNNLKEDVTYNFSDVYIGKFKNERILKSSEITKITEAETILQIDLETRSVQDINQILTCRVITLDSNNIKDVKRCPKCKTEVDEDDGDGIAICEKCNTVSQITECTSQTYVSTLCQRTDTKEKINLKLPLEYLLSLTTYTIKEKMPFIKAIMKQTLKITIDIRDNAVLAINI